MGRMLDALRQLDEQSNLFTMIRPVAVSPVEHVDQPICESTSPEAQATRERSQALPTDPRFRELVGALLSQAAACDGATVLMAGFVDDELSGGQLSAIYRPLADRTEGSMLVVDADWRGATLAERFHLSNVVGLCNILGPETTWQDVVCKTDRPNLDLLSGGHGKESISPDSLSKLLSQWREAYRLVILDAIFSTPHEMARWAVLCDATVIVARLAVTPRETIQEAIQAVRSQGGQVLGCVLLDG